jgi:hypothetical protein
MGLKNRKNGMSVENGMRTTDVEELDMDPVKYQSAQYKLNWLDHIRRMEMLDTQNNFLTIVLLEDKTWITLKETTRWLQS